MSLWRSSLASGARERSRSFAPLSCFLIALCLGAILTHAVAHSQTLRKTPVAPYHSTIEQNVFFYGAEQYYAVTPPLIHVYYQPSAESGSAPEQMPRSPIGMKLQTQSTDDKYLHEIFVLVNGKWAKKYRAVSRKPESYLTENSCDTTNALDLSGGLLRDALPRTIRIKEIEDHVNYAVVVYSDTPDRSEYYSLKTALLERDSLLWHVASTIFSGDAVHYCGTQAFHTKFSNEEVPLVFLLYLGDSISEQPDFISIQSFLVRESKSHPSEREKMNPVLNSNTP